MVLHLHDILPTLILQDKFEIFNIFLKPNMEYSPIRFLDYDVSLMLADQVNISQEEEARRFHCNLRKNSKEINLNWEHHYLMARVFEDIGYLLANFTTIQLECWSFATEKDGFKRCYDVCAKSYIENTRLRRCGYNH